LFNYFNFNLLPYRAKNLLHIKRWLQYNVETLEHVLIKWQETVLIRRQFLLNTDTQINNILEGWLLYKPSFGHTIRLIYFKNINLLIIVVKDVIIIIFLFR